MENSLVSSGLALQGYVILAAYMAGMLFIGVYCNKRFTNNLSGYLMGGRSLGPWVFALTYGSTYLSSSTFIGNTSAAYKGGMAYLMMPFLQMVLLPLGLVYFSGALRRQS
ncbi:MAG: hypothetical protein LBR87_04105, partial [Synergistaceae bacterium]|nr:hypothetical protein [Synergistaceae bacterium]